MKEVTITIEGITPLIANKFTDKAQMEASNGNRLSTIGDRGTPKEIAESKLYVDEDGNPVIPQPNLFRADGEIDGLIEAEGETEADGLIDAEGDLDDDGDGDEDPLLGAMANR